MVSLVYTNLGHTKIREIEEKNGLASYSLPAPDKKAENFVLSWECINCTSINDDQYAEYCVTCGEENNADNNIYKQESFLMNYGIDASPSVSNNSDIIAQKAEEEKKQ